MAARDWGVIGETLLQCLVGAEGRGQRRAKTGGSRKHGVLRWVLPGGPGFNKARLRLHLGALVNQEICFPPPLESCMADEVLYQILSRGHQVIAK
jgi:hypothetical protein